MSYVIYHSPQEDEDSVSMHEAASRRPRTAKKPTADKLKIQPKRRGIDDLPADSPYLAKHLRLDGQHYMPHIDLQPDLAPRPSGQAEITPCPSSLLGQRDNHKATGYIQLFNQAFDSPKIRHLDNPVQHLNGTQWPPRPPVGRVDDDVWTSIWSIKREIKELRAMIATQTNASICDAAAFETALEPVDGSWAEGQQGPTALPEPRSSLERQEQRPLRAPEAEAGNHRLQKKENKCDVLRIGPGAAIITQPAQNCTAVRETKAAAMSINPAMPGEPVFSKRLTPVARNLSTGAEPNDRMSRPNANTSKRQPASSSSGAVKRRKTDNVNSKPSMDLLAKAVTDMEAFTRLCTLINTWRAGPSTSFQLQGSNYLGVQLVNIIENPEGSSLLMDFLNRFAKAKLADIIDQSKLGRLAADPLEITKLLGALNWNSKNSRQKLHRYLAAGRKWNALCEGVPGLLCLIPPNRDDAGLGVKANDYLGIDNAKKFRQLLSHDYAQLLLRMGTVFRDLIWNRREVPQIEWDDEHSGASGHLPTEELMLLVGGWSAAAFGKENRK